MTRSLSALGLVLGLVIVAGTGCHASRVAHDFAAPPGLLRYDTIAAHSNCQNARPHLFGRTGGLHARHAARRQAQPSGYGGYQGGGYEGGGYCPNCQPGMNVHGFGGHGVAGFHGSAHQELYTQQPFAGPNGPPTGQYAYPYYTNRAPRDFLIDNPPSIGGN